jgi:hypothetical protein
MQRGQVTRIRGRLPGVVPHAEERPDAPFYQMGIDIRFNGKRMLGA